MLQGGWEDCQADNDEIANGDDGDGFLGVDGGENKDNDLQRGYGDK